jgi:hypothetical protein
MIMKLKSRGQDPWGAVEPAKKKLCTKELSDPYRTFRVVRIHVLGCRRLQLFGNVVRMKETRNVCRILVGKPRRRVERLWHN